MAAVPEREYVLELVRDTDGMVTRMAYKVPEREDSSVGDTSEVSFTDMVSGMFESEKLADQSLLIRADLSLSPEAAAALDKEN